MNKTIIAAELAVFLLMLISPAASAAGNYKYTRFLPDGNGGFYEFNFDESGYRLYSVSASGERSASFHGSDPMTGISTTDGRILLIAQKKTTQPVFLSDGLHSQSVVFLPGLDLSGELIGADRRHRIYAVDKSSPKQIRTYDSKGTQTGVIDAGFEVTNIFSDSDGVLWASGRGGCIFLASGESFAGDTPTGQFSLCGQYCCGSDGSVFRFSAGRFELLGKYSSPVCCTGKGEIFTADGQNVTLVGEDGKPSKTMDVGTKVTALYASGSTAAYISSGELHIIDKSLMQTVITEESSQPQQSSVSSEPSKPQSSSPESSASVKRPESSVYDLSGKYIYISEGTTAAALKENISFDGYSIQLFDRYGKAISSGRLGTGARAVFARGSERYEYTLILPGDITGEGNINSRDELSLSEMLLGEGSADENTLPACDLNGSGKADLGDLVMLYYLAERGVLPSPLLGHSGSAGITLTPEEDILPGRAFYVYLTFSTDTDAGGAIISVSYDASKLRLTSAKLSDKQGSDTFRTNDISGTVRLLLINTNADMKSRTAALRFEPLTDGADSYSFNAELCEACGKDGVSLRCSDPVNIKITTYKQESSESSRPAESSAAKTSEKASSASVKEASSKAQTSRRETDKQEAETHEEEEKETISVPRVREPEDASKRYMLIAGTVVLVFGAAAGGYALARNKKK